MTESLNSVKPAQINLYPRFIQDLAVPELYWIENHAGRMREQMRSLLERFQIGLPAPAKSSRWLLQTCLTYLDMALEELYPEQMKGYGEIDHASASDLTWTLDEIRKLLSQMSAFLAESG